MLRRALLVLACLSAACSNMSSLETADGRTRRFLLRSPADGDGTSLRPVVLVFHGGGGNPGDTEASTKMTEAALEAGYLVVYPEGLGKSVLGKQFGTWNAGECCGTAVKEQIDDVGFVAQLLDVLERDHGADPRRVYATGLSNGAFMVGRLACELSERITAVAPIAGVRFTESCRPVRPVPMLILHGTDDGCVPIEGGAQCGGCFSAALAENYDDPPEVQDEFPCDAVSDASDFWVGKNACAGPVQMSQPAQDTACVSYTGCQDGAEVRRCVIEGGGHTWPGGEYNCNPKRDYCQAYMKAVGRISDLDANAMILDFFSRQSLSVMTTQD